MPGWTWRTASLTANQHSYLITAVYDAFGLEHIISLSVVWQIVVQ